MSDDAEEPLLEDRVGHDELVPLEQAHDRSRPPARGFAQLVEVNEAAIDGLVDRALELELTEVARDVDQGADRAGHRHLVARAVYPTHAAVAMS